MYSLFTLSSLQRSCPILWTILQAGVISKHWSHALQVGKKSVSHTFTWRGKMLGWRVSARVPVSDLQWPWLCSCRSSQKGNCSRASFHSSRLRPQAIPLPKASSSFSVCLSAPCLQSASPAWSSAAVTRTQTCHSPPDIRSLLDDSQLLWTEMSL